MKIPETSANVGAYYGNEENGQWQPNGVIIDSGVGGGVVGSGDAGIHRPPVYPLHIPRGHIPGYVMAGAYYPPAPYAVAAPAPAHDDFEDYMWMENEEEFDKQVMQQLEEEALMEQCIEAMLEDEQREQRHRAHNGHSQYPTTSNGSSLSLEETVSRSTLNPLAAEFVPTTAPPRPPPEEKVASTEVNPTEASPAPAPAPVTSQEPAEAPPGDTPEEPSPVAEPPEASAADVTPADRRPKDAKRDSKPKDAKKPVAKVESKPKAKPAPAKAETKAPPKKKEPKPAAGDAAPAPAPVAPAATPAVVEKPQPTLTEETPSAPGLKPINYAAAARANKPKPKPTDKVTPTEKVTPPPKAEKKIEKVEKKEKPVQRKNSAK